MARIAALFLAASLALATGSWQVHGSEASKLDQILERGVLRVGTTGDYKPFTSLDKSTGQYTGLDIDQAQSLGAALGVKVEFVATSWPTLMSDFLADTFDVGIGGISVTLERQKKALFSAPYLREGKTPIARCADTDKFQTLEAIDKADVKVIVNPGGTNEKFARAHLKTAPITVFPDNSKIFDEIAQGRADVMMTDASETRFQQKRHAGVLCAIHPDQPFDFSEKALLLPRDAVLKAFVDQWLRQSIESGAFAALRQRWLD